MAVGVTARNVAKVDAGPYSGWSTAPNWPVFEVPADSRTFRFTYEPVFTYHQRPEGPLRNGKLEAMSFDVTFPK